MENGLDCMKKYEEAKQALYNHVGFVEDWVVCPICDATEYYWKLNEHDVSYSENLDSAKNEDGDHYNDKIYRQKFYENHVYEGQDLTMVFCDPQVDGVQWFRFFDNKKRIK